MMPVNDVSLKTTLLVTLLNRINVGDIEPLIALGMPAEDLESLRSLSAADITLLASQPLLTINYAVTPRAINLALAAIKVQTSYEAELEAFINAGASLSMLRQLFRTDIEQVKSYREMLAHCTKPGRPSMPDAQARDAIHKAWAVLRAQHGLSVVIKSNSATRKALLQLHAQFATVSMEALFSVLHEFDLTRGAA
jgi:Protein of unknown function (DUF2857)